MWSAGIFDPLGFAKGSNLASLKTKEIKNGVLPYCSSRSSTSACPTLAHCRLHFVRFICQTNLTL